jgi:hypothetical protein
MPANAMPAIFMALLLSCLIKKCAELAKRVNASYQPNIN